MRSAVLVAACAALAAATPVAQSGASGCKNSFPAFQIQTVNVTSSKRDLSKRQGPGGSLTITLDNGILHDQNTRIGYIAANDQLQFDKPVQAGAKQQSGFSVCANNYLALDGNNIWYACLSGNFNNLYSKSQGKQCNQVYIQAINAGASSGSSASGAASQQPDGQPTAGAASQISDGQVQATSAAGVSQISDGQIQATTAAGVSQISDGQIQATTAAGVSQISDGQIQATTAAPVSQISDGQIQATTAAPVSQISDGQIQATTAAPVSQISDGQIQATTAAPVSQISDGQIQATTAAAVSQIGDGQIQAGNGTVAKPTVSPYTGAASGLRGDVIALVGAGIFAIAML